MPAMPPFGGPDSDPPGDWTYSGTPSDSDLDTVRFYLRDTNPRVRLLGDQEIQFLIDEWMPRYDSLIYVASVAADAIANAFAGTVSISADGVNVDVSRISEAYANVAMRMRAMHKDAQIGGEVDITNLMWGQYVDPSIDPLQFKIGLDDNIEAGRQNYGDASPSYTYEDSVGWL